MPDTQPQQPASTTPPPATPPPASPAPGAPAAPASKPPMVSPADVAAPVLKKSSHLKLVLGITGVLFLCVVGVVFYQIKSKSNTMYQDSYKITPSATPSLSPSPTPTPGVVKSGDAQLDQQGQVIDDGINKLNDDIKDVDKGLQDKQTNLN